MALDPIKNFAKVTVSTGYDSAATSITLNSGDGNKLPDPATDGAFNLVWWNATDYPDPSDDPNVEIVRVTAKSGDTLTITRGQEGTSAADHNTSGKTYKMVLAVTEKTISDINSTFIPYEGATQNVDLGSYGLTTNSLTIGSLSGVLKASSGVVSGGAGLNDLSDVNVSSPSDGDVLAWDSGTSKWIASTPSGGGGGWELVSHQTASGRSITISNLDLSSDKTYKVVFTCSSGSNTFLRLYFNGVNSGGHYFFSRHYTQRSNGSDTHSYGSYWGQDLINIGVNVNFTILSGESELYLSGSRVVGHGRTFAWDGNTSSGSADLQDFNWTGGADSTITNLTSLTLYSYTNTTCSWEVWIFKPAT